MAKVEIRNLKENRTVLRDVVPVDTPFLVGFFLGDICNFKCKYCIQSVEGETPETKVLKRKFMDWDVFQKAVQDLKEFPNPIKTVMLSSIGEPLLHPQVGEMLRYMNKQKLAANYEIVTNASMLTEEMTKNLIDNGLTRLCISMQGITSEKYKEICGYQMDMDELYQNLKFFYEYGRGKCKLHIKTVDVALDEGEDKIFLERFSNICDTIFIDQVIPVFKGVDYTDLVLDQEPFQKEQFEKYATACCSPIFYTLYILADGSVAPCCDSPQPTIYGNVKEDKITDIWKGKDRIAFLTQHLEGKKNQNEVCKKCVAPMSIAFEEDKLDGAQEEILNRIREKYGENK